MTAEQREQFLNQSGYYTEDQVAALLGITVRTLRNRHSARKNCPPKTPEGLYPIDEFEEWNRKRLIKQVNKAS